MFFPGITRGEIRRRKKRNTVTTGYNLAVWLIEVMAGIIITFPLVLLLLLAVRRQPYKS